MVRVSPTRRASRSAAMWEPPSGAPGARGPAAPPPRHRVDSSFWTGGGKGGQGGTARKGRAGGSRATRAQAPAHAVRGGGDGRRGGAGDGGARAHAGRGRRAEGRSRR